MKKNHLNSSEINFKGDLVYRCFRSIHLLRGEFEFWFEWSRSKICSANQLLFKCNEVVIDEWSFKYQIQTYIRFFFYFTSSLRATQFGMIENVPKKSIFPKYYLTRTYLKRKMACDVANFKLVLRNLVEKVLNLMSTVI